jgi:hypothetical protein
MPHRNNIAGRSLRRNRKSPVAAKKSTEFPEYLCRLSRGPPAAFLCGAATIFAQSRPRSPRFTSFPGFTKQLRRCNKTFVIHGQAGVKATPH